MFDGPTTHLRPPGRHRRAPDEGVKIATHASSHHAASLLEGLSGISDHRWRISDHRWTISDHRWRISDYLLCQVVQPQEQSLHNLSHPEHRWSISEHRWSIFEHLWRIAEHRWRIFKHRWRIAHNRSNLAEVRARGVVAHTALLCARRCRTAGPSPRMGGASEGCRAWSPDRS